MRQSRRLQDNQNRRLQDKTYENDQGRGELEHEQRRDDDDERGFGYHYSAFWQGGKKGKDIDEFGEHLTSSRSEDGLAASQSRLRRRFSAHRQDRDGDRFLVQSPPES
jgi:hypothetical protein